MQDDGKNFVSNTNKINSLSDKNSNIEKILLNSVCAGIRNEISSYLPGLQYLKIFAHNKKHLKSFSESDYFFQNKYYTEFLNDILIHPDVVSIFYMCDFIFMKDIESLEKELTNEEKQKFHYITRRNAIDIEFKKCLFLFALPNILHDIFSITLNDFRKLAKEDLAKRPEELKQLFFRYRPSWAEPINIGSYDYVIKPSMIYAYNVLEKTSENQSNESKNCRRKRLDYLKSIGLGTEKVKIKKFSTDDILADDTEKKFRFINYQKLIYRTLDHFYSNFDLAEFLDKFKCDNYLESQNASYDWIKDEYYRQYYTMFEDHLEYFYNFSTLEEFDTAWNSAKNYMSDKSENRYYKYLFIIADGDQDKFVKFLEKKAKSRGDSNMLYRCDWCSAICEVAFLSMWLIAPIISCCAIFIAAESIFDLVLLSGLFIYATIMALYMMKKCYTEHFKPFFAKHTPFQYKYNSYLQNKYPILKPENRDKYLFNESEKFQQFQQYKKRIVNEKKRFEIIATKYQASDKSIIEQPKILSLQDNNIIT